MMMMDENIITITKINPKINSKSNTASTTHQQQQAKTDSTSSSALATLYRQEMIDLEYEIFFLEEDIMHIVHRRKEMQRCLQ